MLEATVNHNLKLKLNSSLTKFEDLEENITFSSNANGSYQINIGSTSHVADIVNLDAENKLITVKINQNRYEVKITEAVDQLIEKLGITIQSSKKNNQLVSPMPGLILKILVTSGQNVKKGEPLIILEAMKMENVYKTAADCIINEICVSEKNAVEKGQILITFQ
jgi:biotin carboxyl carrier protein